MSRISHPNDTLQIICRWGTSVILIKEPNRLGGPCWELPGGSYQLQNERLSVEQAAAATLQHKTGIVIPADRFTVIHEQLHPWNGIDPTKNACAGARVYVVEVSVERGEFPSDVSRFEFCEPDGDLCTYRPTDWFAYAALGVWRAKQRCKKKK